jgi:predicted glycoside hydrolase/deacetylase ChbG (UPF0249 family)
MRKILIVNADDFGLSAGINAGIIRAHEHGIVTSASLMVRGLAAAAAAAYARSHSRLAVGLHVDLAEWECVNDERRLAHAVVDPDDPAAVTAETARQLALFRELVGRDPAHLDSRQHVHHTGQALAVLTQAAQALNVVLRGFTPGVHYCGDFHGQSNEGHPCRGSISVEGLLETLGKIPEGVTELDCHPAVVADMDSDYREERMVECATLCDARVREAVMANRIELSANAPEWLRVWSA